MIRFLGLCLVVAACLAWGAFLLDRALETKQHGALRHPLAAAAGLEVWVFAIATRTEVSGLPGMRSERQSLMSALVRWRGGEEPEVLPVPGWRTMGQGSVVFGATAHQVVLAGPGGVLAVDRGTGAVVPAAGEPLLSFDVTGSMDQVAGPMPHWIDGTGLAGWREANESLRATSGSWAHHVRVDPGRASAVVADGRFEARGGSGWRRTGPGDRANACDSHLEVATRWIGVTHGGDGDLRFDDLGGRSLARVAGRDFFPDR